MMTRANVKKSLTKKEALSNFREAYLPAIREAYEQDRRIDHVARREEWNNYVDYLCEDGLISQSQRDNWSNPF